MNRGILPLSSARRSSGPGKFDRIFDETLIRRGFFDFKGIPPGYIYLQVMLSIRDGGGDGGADSTGVGFYFNSDSAGTYRANYAYGNNATEVRNVSNTTHGLAAIMTGSGGSAGSFSAVSMVIPRYSERMSLINWSTAPHFMDGASAGWLTYGVAGSWTNSSLAPVDRLTIFAVGGALLDPFEVGSRMTVWGIG